MKRKSLGLFIVMTGLLFLGCPTEVKDDPSPATVSALQAAVDSSLATATNKAGISVALYTAGYTWKYAAGNASAGVPMTTETPSYAYSITKTIVSALVLSQIEAGLYSLDDTVESLLSGNTDYISLSPSQKALINKDATVAQLLTHTSGMSDYTSNANALIEMANPSLTTWKPMDIIEKVVSLPFSADNWNNHVYEYSNTNYVLLGIIAEYKGGKNLNVLLAEKFFTPLAISALLTPQDAVPLDIAHPYDDISMFTGATVLFMDLTIALGMKYPSYDFFTGTGRTTWAAGGIVATAENIAKWGYELYSPNGDAVSSAVRTTLEDSAQADGAYGYGVTYTDFTYSDGTAGGKYGHDGSAPGYKTLLRYETNQGISVAIMTNENNIPGSATTQKDSELGLVDRDALATALLNVYKNDY